MCTGYWHIKKKELIFNKPDFENLKKEIPRMQREAEEFRKKMERARIPKNNYYF